MDYFYGGTAICYNDLWSSSDSKNYNGECQLPKSFSNLPFLPSLDDTTSVVEQNDYSDKYWTPSEIETNSLYDVKN